MSSSASRSWKYDVFLSFSGQDTRNTFVDHLYYALEQRAIRTYKDDVTLDRGDTIGPSLLKAIEESHILVIIFSENYADSPWCLDELSHIMKCRNNEKGQIVFPVFYHVDPSDVRKQKRKYEEAFAKYKLSENNKKKAKVWKKALADASNIAGWESKHVANGGTKEDNAMEILDACGFYPRIGVKVLIQKALITISADGKFDMHDMVQEMGHYIVRGEHPNNPEKHSRVWRNQDIKDMCSRNATMENDKIEAIKCDVHGCSSNCIMFVSNMKLRSLQVWGQGNYATMENDKIEAFKCDVSDCSSSFIMLVSNMKKLRFLKVTTSFDEGPGFLSNELRYIEWESYPVSPFPESFNPTKLVVLKIDGSLQKELWKGYKMDKLEILRVSECKALVEFPKIEAKMDNLTKLKLISVGIEVVPSSVGEYCTNLISLKLEGCSELKSIEGNFYALKHLKKFELILCRQLEKVPEDLFHENCHLEKLSLYLCDLVSSSNKQLTVSRLPRFLRKLDLSLCELKDGEIPSEIGELMNLQELHLRYNSFTRLDFSLLHLTRLKLLGLNGCDNLVELPELPSSLAILRADCCSSLNAIIRDDIHINCKSLCKVSIVKGGKSIIGGERLLETMLLQAHKSSETALCMSLRLEGPEIANGFEPRLVRGRRCGMHLPENWYNHFCGFLICAVLNAYAIPMITMTHVEKVEKGGSMETDHYYWRESVVDKNKGTWVGYVSFGVLRNTSRWDQTSPAIQIEIQTDDSSVCGCGFKLIPKASENGQREKTPTNSSSEYSDDEYTCPFEIQHDSKHDLQCFFN